MSLNCVKAPRTCGTSPYLHAGQNQIRTVTLRLILSKSFACHVQQVSSVKQIQGGCKLDLILTINNQPGMPVYRLLANAVQQAIIEQGLDPGVALPSVRGLANQYHLSVSTVVRAYEELASRGCVVTQPHTATRVAGKFAGQPTEHSKSRSSTEIAAVPLRDPKLSLYAQRLLSSEQLTAREIAIPGAEQVPTAIWHRLLAKHRSNYSREKALNDYSADPFGHAPLRMAIAEFLKRSRNIQCTLDQVVLTTSLRLDLFCRLVVNAGDKVAMENPCSPAARRIVFSHGAQIDPIDVDSSGLNPEPLFGDAGKYQALYLCPSHQDPSGVALSVERRLSILDWSQRTDTIIFENDVDSNYHYTGAPLPAIQSLGENDTVIYSGSFWLVLGPLASIGFFVLPRRYISAMRSLVSTVHPEPPVPENHALAEFISEGHLERHIQRQRISYSKKRQALIFELARLLHRRVTFEQSSGLHTVVQFDRAFEQQAIMHCAASAGLNLISTQRYYAGEYRPNEFIVPFASLDGERIAAIAERFSSLLQRR